MPVSRCQHRINTLHAFANLETFENLENAKQVFCMIMYIAWYLYANVSHDLAYCVSKTKNVLKTIATDDYKPAGWK